MNKFRARVFGRSFGKIFGDLVAISGIIVYNNYLRSAVRVAAALRDRGSVSSNSNSNSPAELGH